jgi:F0F1-type ATP synthase epsilon subunit
MGVERAVTRWHLQQQQIHNEITTLEAKLASAHDKRETDSIHQQLTHARKKLDQLGPCPKPMMG